MRHHSFHLVQRAWAAYQAEHYDIAEQEVRSALAIEPNDSEALSVLSLCAMQRQQRAAAVQLAEQAISHAADEAIYHYRLALIHGRFGDHKAAEPPLRISLELEPTLAPAYSLYAWVYFVRGHIKIALTAIDEALKFDPTDTYALNLRIELLKAKGDHKRARVAALEALQVDPENERAHALAGVLNLKLRDRDCGISHLQEAVRLDPGVENVRRTYVEALEGSRPFARVLQAVRRELSEGVIEFGYICGTAWIVYLCLRQKEGPLVIADWPLPFIAVTIVLHLLLLVVWWGPFLVLVTVRDTHSFQVICGEFSFRDRTRFARPWHICLSLGIIISVFSLVLPGMYWAPLSGAFASMAVPLRMAELVSSRVGKFTAYLYAFAVMAIAFFWAFSPNALRFGKDVPNSIMNYVFVAITLISIGLLAAVWSEAKQQAPKC